MYIFTLTIDFLFFIAHEWVGLVRHKYIATAAFTNVVSRNAFTIIILHLLSFHVVLMVWKDVLGGQRLPVLVTFLAIFIFHYLLLFFNLSHPIFLVKLWFFVFVFDIFKLALTILSIYSCRILHVIFNHGIVANRAKPVLLEVDLSLWKVPVWLD